MQLPKLLVAPVVALICALGSARAQDPKSVCANLIAHRDAVSNGTFPKDQLAGMIHGTSAADLARRAEASGDKKDHYTACANYMLAAAAFRDRGGSDVKDLMKSTQILALYEQAMGDGKQLGMRDRMAMSLMRQSLDIDLDADKPAHR